MPAKSITTTVIVSMVTPRPGGGAFFTGQETSGKWLRVKADYDCISRVPVRGETWQLTGEFKYHDIYGNQLHLEHGKLVTPTGHLLVSFLCAHPAFRGIGVGAGKVAKLYKRFGDELRVILENRDVSSLNEILSQAAAEKLVRAWSANAQESSVIAFLDEHGIDVRLARRILKYWGEAAVEKLRENPYRLLILTSWDNVDKIARNLGVAPFDSLRLVAATEAWTYQRLDKHKDTLTDGPSLKKGIRHLVGRAVEDVAQRAIELAVQDRAIVGDSITGYQPMGCAVMEQHLAGRFTAMLPVTKGVQIDLFGTTGSNSLVDAQIDSFERQERIQLNIEQRRAVHMSSTSPLSVLKGGAGVGKTTVLKVVHQAVKAMNGTAFQMALAGRAAQRMREATNEDAYTIVGFLNYLKNDKLKLKGGDLVIIDESSMLDLMLVYRLVRTLPQGVRMLLVGDPYQLPPIGPGLIFHVLANSSKVPSTELTQIHRQAASTGIPQIADQVRNGIITEIAKYQGLATGVSFIECNECSIINYLTDIIGDLGGFQDTQILGVIKSGAAGVHNINQTFHKIMTTARTCLHGWELAESDPIVYTVNDYERELFNGSLGYIEKVFPYISAGDAPTRAIVNFESRKIELSEADLGNVELAYAITVHKAQGSQFRRVVIPITRSRILDRTLIYTALTRGVEQVVFVGDKSAFNEAVLNPPSASLRQVGFSI